MSQTSQQTTSKPEGQSTSPSSSSSSVCKLAKDSNSSACMKTSANGQQATTTATANKQELPMIVKKVQRFPLVQVALSLGCTQYNRLKSSNVTVGEVMNRAENLASYLWQKMSPYVTKLQEPIEKADRLACDTLDFVESKLEHMNTLKTQAVETLSTTLKAQS